MGQQFEVILTWFFSRPGDEDRMYAWLDRAHAQAVAGEAVCACDLHKAMHVVTHLIKKKDMGRIQEGSPWIQAAFLVLVEDFLFSTKPLPSDLLMSAVLMCRAAQKQIAEEHDLKLTEEGEELRVVPGPIKLEEKHDDDESSSMSEEDTDSEHDETSDEQDDEDTMANEKKPHDAPITAPLAGTEFLKDGVKVTPPPGMTYGALIQALERQAKEEEQLVRISERIDAFVLEGAVAFHQALKEEFGWTQAGTVAPPEEAGFLAMLMGKAVQTDNPVRTLSVQTGLETTEQVVWDQVRMPGVDGHLGPGFDFEDGRFFFLVTGEVKKKHEPRVRQIIATTKRLVRESSIYKGHALEVDLPTDGYLDIARHAPRFMKGLDAIDPASMIFTRKLEEELETYVFNIIRNTELLAKLGISAHRGALFMGPPGVGKTLAAAVTAKIAEQHGWTFFYLKKPDQLVPTYKLASAYGDAKHGAVLFVEDIDQAVLNGGEEDVVDEDARRKFRELLNTLDGIDTKGAQVFVIFTTNKDPRRFDPTFTRESRLDSIINFTPPDQEAVERLLRWYLGERLDPAADLTVASKALAGVRPASIKEVAAKAILGAARRLQNVEALNGIINAADLEVAVRVSKEQFELAKPLEQAKTPNSDEERAAVFLGNGVERAAAHLATTLETLAERLLPKPTSNGAASGKPHLLTEAVPQTNPLAPSPR